MWTGIIAVIAFCGGFLLASLLACAKSADREIEVMRKPASTRVDRRQKAVRPALGPSVMIPTGVTHLPNRDSDETGTCTGSRPVLDNNRRVEAT